MVEGRLSEQNSWKVVGGVDESRKTAAAVVLWSTALYPRPRAASSPPPSSPEYPQFTPYHTYQNKESSRRSSRRVRYGLGCGVEIGHHVKDMQRPSSVLT